MRGGPRAIISDVLPALADGLDDAAEVVLVLDDAPCSSPANDAALDVFAARAPPTVQVVVSTRSDPRLPLGRLRAHGELVDIRADQLRLTDAEAAELFARVRIELDPADAARLNSRTEGWVTGLHLASILALDHDDRTAFVASFSGESRSVLDYLASDVLAKLPLEQREFLLRTSILDRLSGPLCDATLMQSGSAAMLDELERANLFVVRLEGHDAYRYHPLFASMLRNELEMREPDAMPTLHARASAWLEQHGDHEAAVEHAICGRDAPRASDLVTMHFRAHERRPGHAPGPLARAALLAQARAEPQLAVTRAAVAAQTGRTAEEIEGWLEVAAAGTRPGPLASGVSSLASGVAIVRSVYLTRGPEVAVKAARLAVQAERATSGWRRQALLGLGQALYLLGRTEAARAALDEARRLPGARENAAATANVLSYVALSDLERHDAAGAERLARRALRLLAEQRISGGHRAPPTRTPHSARRWSRRVGSVRRSTSSKRRSRSRPRPRRATGTHTRCFASRSPATASRTARVPAPSSNQPRPTWTPSRTRPCSPTSRPSALSTSLTPSPQRVRRRGAERTRDWPSFGCSPPTFRCARSQGSSTSP